MAAEENGTWDELMNAMLNILADIGGVSGCRRRRRRCAGDVDWLFFFIFWICVFFFMLILVLLVGFCVEISLSRRPAGARCAEAQHCAGADLDLHPHA